MVSLHVHVAGSVSETVQRLASGVAPGGTLLLVGHRPVDPQIGAATPAAGLARRPSGSKRPCALPCGVSYSPRSCSSQAAATSSSSRSSSSCPSGACSPTVGAAGVGDARRGLSSPLRTRPGSKKARVGRHFRAVEPTEVNANHCASLPGWPIWLDDGETGAPTARSQQRSILRLRPSEAMRGRSGGSSACGLAANWEAPSAPCQKHNLARRRATTMWRIRKKVAFVLVITRRSPLLCANPACYTSSDSRPRFLLGRHFELAEVRYLIPMNRRTRGMGVAGNPNRGAIRA